MFTEEVIQSVKDRNDIIEIVSGYVALRKAGRNYIGLCPFHAEKTPSFTVNPEKQIYHCFGCGAGGDVFSFVERQEGLSFPDAVRRLAERAGMPLPVGGRSQAGRKDEDERRRLLAVNADAFSYFERELRAPSGRAAREYLERRGLTEAAIKGFGLGYSRPEWDGLLKFLRNKGYDPGIIEKAGLIVKRSEKEGHYDRFRNRIMFPIRDLAGNVIAFGGRVMDDSLPKYLNSPETPLYSKANTLYGLERAKEEGRRLGYFIIVEGYLDAIACHQYGARNTVATLGTALTEGHLRLLRRFARKIVMIFDPDAAGVNAVLRGFELFAASDMKVNVVSLPDGDDPDTFLKKHGFDAFSMKLKDSVRLMDFVLSRVVGGTADLSIEEKVEKARQMLSLISRLSSRIEQDHYIKKTAEALDIGESVLRQEAAGLRRAVAALPKESRIQGGKAAAAQPRPKAEEILIHLMIRDASLAKDLAAEISPEEFTDPLFRKAAELIFSSIQRGDSPDASVLARAADEETARLITRYAVLDGGYQDPRKTCRDCVKRIKERGRTLKMKAIVKAITEAEQKGDKEALQRLLNEQKELARARRY